ncbi:unnamed protein product [Blepharisma stoltei]|uniref:Uncharacterized protein n=1 Tax=Blepharisma stoltei TaxID=1481888 RepID=A0AAU9IKI1_9CILI|nr:unnamed protein product [Blepharisma stoltei]
MPLYQSISQPYQSINQHNSQSEINLLRRSFKIMHKIIFYHMFTFSQPSSKYPYLTMLESIEEMQRKIEYSIEEKLETFLGKRLLNIEKRLEENDKAINEKFAEVNFSISKLENEIKNLKIKFKDWRGREEVELKFESQINSFSSQINSTLKDLNKKIDDIAISQSFQEQNLPDLSRINQELVAKSSEILNRLNNSPEIELEFRKTCSLYENLSLHQSISQAYQEYKDSYSQITSLYLTSQCNEKNTYLTVYDTENERENVKILETPQSLNSGTCIAQLPNGELFCFGKREPTSGLALIVSKNCKIRNLPFGAYCYGSSAIYFNKGVYCFGGTNYNGNLPLSANLI